MTPPRAHAIDGQDTHSRRTLSTLRADQNLNASWRRAPLGRAAGLPCPCPARACECHTRRVLCRRFLGAHTLALKC
eukprot:6180962-Pleurochrysis_carterae.AAC.1